MNEEWCREQLKNLQIRDLRTNTLTEIKNQLISHPNDEVVISTNFIQSQELLDCLKDTTNEQTALACDILSICMSNLTIEQTVNNSNVLENSLKHPNDNVKVLAINAIQKSIDSTSIKTDMNLIVLLVNCLESDESKVGTPCIEILVKLLPHYVQVPPVKQALASTLTHPSSIVKCRTYEIAIKLAQQSPILLQNVEYMLQQALADLKSNDVLLQLNILELFSVLPWKEHGLIYIEKEGLLQKFSNQLETLDENPLQRILIPGIIRFFGNISIWYPSKIFNGYPNFIDFIFNHITSDDLSIKPVAFDTLGNFGRSPEGKLCLDSSPRFIEVLKFISRYLIDCPTEIKCRGLNCLAILFDTNTENINNQITCICQSWLKTLYPINYLEQVMNFCRIPFSDIKKEALGLLKAIIQHEFGQEALLQTAGFMEYLLNRNSETDKDALQEKFECIRLLSNSRVFNAQQILQLKKYVLEGPFYVQGITEVMLDEN